MKTPPRTVELTDELRTALTSVSTATIPWATRTAPSSRNGSLAATAKPTSRSNHDPTINQY